MKNIAIVCFSIIWIFVLFTDYWNKHLLHRQGFLNFSHFSYVITWLILTGMLALAYAKSGPINAISFIRSKALIPVLFIILTCISYVANFKYSGLEFSGAAITPFIGKFLLSLLLLFIIWMSTYALGNWIRVKLNLELVRGPSFTLDLVIGLVVQSLVLFLVAALKLFILPVVIVLLLIPLGLNYKGLFSWYKNNLGGSYTDVKWHDVGLFSIILLLLSINYIADMAPFPTGFDSRNYYLNVVKLIVDRNGLIYGYQPYPWQLFMAQGQIFMSGMMAMLLSFSAIVFVIQGIYEIATKYLNLNRSIALLAGILFISLPAVQNHLFVELKVDLGLLIVQCAMAIIILDAVKAYQEQQTLPTLKTLILFGVITGYGASIKTLNFYFVFALIVAIWALVFKYKGFLATFLLSIGAIMLAKFDAVTGMDAYHLGLDYTKYACLLIGLVMLILIVIADRQKAIKVIKDTSIYLIIMLVTMAPWLGKNIIETKSTDPNHIIRGGEPGPGINIQKIKQNLKRSGK